MRKLIVAVFMMTVAAGVAYAVSTSTIEIDSINDYLKGESQWVEISALGKIRPGPAFVSHDTGEQQVWSVLAHSSGDYYLGTGVRGRLLKFDGRKFSEVLDTKSAIVTSLAEGRDGKIYAGVAPGGEIFVLNRDGSGGTSLCKLDDEYIWSIVVAQDGTVYAGTGPKGKVFAIKPGGGPEEILEVQRDHVVRLALDSKGRVLAATAKKGKLFRIDPSKDNFTRTIAGFSGQEISGLLVTGDDTIILGLNSLKIRAQNPKIVRSENGGGDQENQDQSSGGDRSKSGSTDALAGAKCQLIGISKEGIMSLLFQQNKMYITDIAMEDDGNVVFSTGPNGRIFSITPDYEISLMNDLPESQASTVTLKSGKLAAVSSANPGILYTVDSRRSDRAEFTSSVLDAGLPSHWGRVLWMSNDYGGIEVETRSGNTDNPDPSWSEWKKVGKNGDSIESPGSQYIQIRIKWKNKTAEISSVRVFFRPVNQKPLIYDAAVARSKSKRKRGSGRQESTIFQVNWKVRNSDADNLGYTLEYRRENADVWVPITLGFIDSSSYKWDTSEMPDGWYRLRITASDAPSNPPGKELESKWITEPFLIDNKQPVVADLKVRKNMVSGKAIDDFSIITDIQYSLDGGLWTPVWPLDGFFDQTTEFFNIELKELDPGDHEVTIMAVDEGGNLGSQSITFTYRK